MTLYPDFECHMNVMFPLGIFSAAIYVCVCSYGTMTKNIVKLFCFCHFTTLSQGRYLEFLDLEKLFMKFIINFLY